eukprot:jgi/Mesen1/6131/ME000313S05255
MASVSSLTCVAGVGSLLDSSPGRGGHKSRHASCSPGRISYNGLCITRPVSSSHASQETLASVVSSALAIKRSSSQRAVARAEYRREGGGGSDFISGFFLGGLVFGTLGFVFAPQLSRVLLGENPDGTPRRLPRWMDDDDSLEATRRKMNEKIAELNLAIDSTSAQLRADDIRQAGLEPLPESAV